MLSFILMLSMKHSELSECESLIWRRRGLITHRREPWKWRRRRWAWGRRWRCRSDKLLWTWGRPRWPGGGCTGTRRRCTARGLLRGGEREREGWKHRFMMWEERGRREEENWGNIWGRGGEKCPIDPITHIINLHGQREDWWPAAETLRVRTK